MGNITTKEALVTRWAALVNDPSLHDLPYKLELNAEGKIEMSPASNRHGIIQAEIAWALRAGLPGGRVVTECSIFTDIGIRVADVAWASEAFLAFHRDDTPFTAAPEICVEITSPSNSMREIEDKIRTYLAAGAHEVWVVDIAGEMRIIGADGPRAASAFNIAVKLPPVQPL